MDEIKNIFNQLWSDIKESFGSLFSTDSTPNLSQVDSKPNPSLVDESPSLTEEPTLDTPKKKEEKHRIAGTSFREKDIKDLMGENVAYDWSKKELIEDGRIEERIYKLDSYCGLAVLEPEPDNPNDPKAIKVLTSGIHIGYIKAGSCAHIHKVLREGRIEKAEVEIKGGAYKVILEEYDDYTDKSTYSIVKDTIPISAVLTLTIKQ